MIRTETDTDKQLRSIYERWDRLEDEKGSIANDLKDLFAEAKSNGFNPKALRAAFRYVAKRKDAAEREKMDGDEADFDIYVSKLIGTSIAPRAQTQAPVAHEAPKPKLVATEPAPAPAPKPALVMQDIPDFLDRRPGRGGTAA